jgi:hypothetical protein
MAIDDFLTTVRETYALGKANSPGHVLLRDAPSYFSPALPGGLVVVGSGGKGRATRTPWIAILDPDETSSPQDGLYLVFIFKAGLEEVVLTLNQGVTNSKGNKPWSVARTDLASDAAVIRESMGLTNLTGLDFEVDFNDSGNLQRAYAAGNIASRTYRVERLPELSSLEKDLSRFVSLYQLAIESKRLVMQREPGSITFPSVERMPAGFNGWDFKPKSDSDYVQTVSGQTFVKSRRHETLVRQYGEHMIGRGAKVWTSEHPIDLALTVDGRQWIAEAKVLYHGNAREAVRATVGQLTEYSHFLRSGRAHSRLALFSEPIGEAFVGLLDEVNIASVWKGDVTWEGSRSALHAGLV